MLRRETPQRKHRMLVINYLSHNIKMLLYCTGKGPRAILVRIEKFLELSARSRENPYIKQRGGEQHMGHVLK